MKSATVVRYIALDGQVAEGERRFAFWDPVRAKFVQVWGKQAWCTVDELNESFVDQIHDLDVDCDDVRRLEALRERLIELARERGAAEE